MAFEVVQPMSLQLYDGTCQGYDRPLKSKGGVSLRAFLCAFVEKNSNKPQRNKNKKRTSLNCLLL